MYSLNVAVRSVVCIDRKTKTFSEARSSRRRLLLLLLLLLLLSPYPFWLKLPNTSHRRGSLVDIRPDDGHEIWLNGHETCAAVPPATSRAASQRSFYKNFAAQCVNACATILRQPRFLLHLRLLQRFRRDLYQRGLLQGFRRDRCYSAFGGQK